KLRTASVHRQGGELGRGVASRFEAEGITEEQTADGFLVLLLFERLAAEAIQLSEDLLHTEACGLCVHARHDREHARLSGALETTVSSVGVTLLFAEDHVEATRKRTTHTLV